MKQCMEKFCFLNFVSSEQKKNIHKNLILDEIFMYAPDFKSFCRLYSWIDDCDVSVRILYLYFLLEDSAHDRIVATSEYDCLCMRGDFAYGIVCDLLHHPFIARLDRIDESGECISLDGDHPITE